MSGMWRHKDQVREGDDVNSWSVRCGSGQLHTRHLCKSQRHDFFDRLWRCTGIENTTSQVAHLLPRMSQSYGVVWKSHADDGYSRRGNFGGSLDRNMALIYSPRLWFKLQEVGVWRARVGLEGCCQCHLSAGKGRSVDGWRLKVVKSCSKGALPIYLFRHFCVV